MLARLPGVKASNRDELFLHQLEELREVVVNRALRDRFPPEEGVGRGVIIDLFQRRRTERQPCGEAPWGLQMP